MRYSNSNHSSNRSKPPEIEKGSDEVTGADREQINELLCELGVDATAEEVLDGAETAEVFMHVRLEDEYAEDYWKATMDNRDVLADEIRVAFLVNGEEGPTYTARNVQKPAYDVFSLPSYLGTGDVADDPEMMDVSSTTVTETASTD